MDREDDGLTRPNYGMLRDLGVGSGAPPRHEAKQANGKRKQRKALPRSGLTIEGLPEQTPKSPLQKAASADALNVSGDKSSEEGPPVKPAQNKSKGLQAGSVSHGAFKKRRKADMEASDLVNPQSAAAPEPQSDKPAGNGNPDTAQISAARLASYAKPTLRRPDGIGQGEGLKQKRKKQEQKASDMGQPLLSSDGTPLTKAQKKNLWRHRRRVAKHGGSSEA